MLHAKKSSTHAKLQHVGQTTFGSIKIKSAESDNVSKYDPFDDDETLSEDEEGGTSHHSVRISVRYVDNMMTLYCLRRPSGRLPDDT